MDGDFVKDFSRIDSFIVYNCGTGDVVIDVDENRESIFKGETVLVSAVCSQLTILSVNRIELLEVYIK